MKVQNKLILPVLVIIFLAGCQSSKQTKNEEAMKISNQSVGIVDGKEVLEYTLTNKHGMMLKIINYGAIVTHLTAPDKNGKYEDVVLGFDEPQAYWNEPYLSNCCYLGAVVGRYGNRIAKGRFTLEGKEYDLAINNGPNHLHGGIKGFDKVVWKSEPLEFEDAVGVRLSNLSPDGEEGYPGNFNIQVDYLLTNKNELVCRYNGSIDQACPVNVTHHGYFNLTGGAKTDILDHELIIHADKYTVVDETLIPTGELRPVVGTPMDFNEAHKIGERIAMVEGGYDHNFVLSDDIGDLRKVIKVTEGNSGRVMEVLTTEPGVQFYSGNFLNGILIGKGKVPYNKHWGFCLETQHFPDSPNQNTFPETVLEPGEKYSHETIYRFSTIQ